MSTPSPKLLKKKLGQKPVARHKRETNPLDTLLLMRYVEAHCEWLAVMRYAKETVITRRRALRNFVGWLNERGILEPREVTKPILERYQRHLYYYRKEDGSALMAGSQVNILRAVKTFFKWAARDNHILYNPASELDVPKVPRHLPRNILTVAEVAAILNATDIGSIYGVRDRAILELLYSTGMRRKEIANLTRSDIDFVRQVVFVKEGKGGKDRVVPLGERAAAWVDKYLIEARPELTVHHADALFVTDFGDPASGYYIAMRVKRYMALAGLERPGAAHLMRHACATHMLEGGADIRFIQALLGHTCLSTTEIYTHVSIEKLKAIHRATHPGAQERVRGASKLAGDGEVSVTSENTAEALFAALDVESEEED